MAKTGQQIITDVIGLLQQSELNMYANGKIYREGMRPRDSRAEDIVAIYTTGYAGQIATGVVTINVYVPDIAPYDDAGVLVSDGARCAQLEGYAQRMVDTWDAGKGDYRWSLREIIHTNHDDDIHQSFIVIKMNYEFINI